MTFLLLIDIQSNIYKVGTYIPLVEAPSKVNSKISIVGVVRGISLPKLTRNGGTSSATQL